jgi:radical SAM protein with 4Fe4S-binding SPASM domain
VPMSRLMRAAAELLARRPALARLLGRDALSILANTCRYSARRPSCGTGLQTVLLDADGSVYPCLNLNQPRFRIASIRQAGYDLPEAWRRSAVLRSLRHDTSIENPERPCSRCPVRHWCLGGCRGETLAVTGNLGGPSPDCLDLRRTMLDMMWRLADTPGLVRPAVKIC